MPCRRKSCMIGKMMRRRKYRHGLQKAAENLGISDSALKTWLRAAREHEGNVPTRGSGNYSSDEAKEIARLQRELRDTKDALEILKKAISILGK